MDLSLDQNLSESERRIRLVIGILLLAVAPIVHSQYGILTLTLAFVFAGLGVSESYFSGVCGCKRLYSRAFDRFNQESLFSTS
jgi:hypothetical protein